MSCQEEDRMAPELRRWWVVGEREGGKGVWLGAESGGRVAEIWLQWSWNTHESMAKVCTSCMAR